MSFNPVISKLNYQHIYSSLQCHMIRQKSLECDALLLNICDPLCEIQAKVSKSSYEITSIKVLISTINFTIISIFDMTLLSQY